MHRGPPGKLREVARARYEAGPSVAELQAFGFDPAGYRVTVIGWEETLPAWDVWERIGNQWRSGAGGAYAIDYSVLFQVLDRMDLDRGDYDELFNEIRCIEAEVLQVLAEQREADEEAARRKR